MKAQNDIDTPMGDLGLFLEIFLDLEKKLKDAEFDEPEKKLIDTFFKTIKNPTKCVITGGAVLQFHLHKDIGAQDIDFFISKRKTLKIIKDFFSNTAIGNFLLEYLKKNGFIAESSNPLKNIMLRINATFQETTGEYGFLKNGFKLWTFQKILGDILKLNFILVDYDSKDLHDGRIFYPSTMISVYPFDNFDTEEMEYLLKPHLDCILHTFDFQELKIMYDFQTESVQPVYKIAHKEYTKDLEFFESLEYLSDIPGSNDSDPLYEKYNKLFFNSYDNFKHKIKDYKVELNRKIERFFIPKIENLDTLTFAPFFLLDKLSWFKLSYFDNFTELADRIDNVLKRSNLSIQKDLLNARQRINKYKEKGFRIIDKYNMIPKMIFFNLVSNYIILGDNNLENILRSSLLNPGKESTLLYKFISEGKKNFVDLSELFDKYKQKESNLELQGLKSI